MKKLLLLTLTAAMVLSMTACSGDIAPVAQPTAQPLQQETSGEVVYASESEIDDIIAGVQPQVLGTADDYESVLRDMGFEEVDLDLHRILRMDGTAGDPTTTVKNITYKDGAFRMEMSAYDQETDTETDGWVLYGTKASEVADISGFDPEACDLYVFDDYAESFPEKYGELTTKYLDYTYFYGENGLTIVKAIFFPETGNLYNLVKTFDNFPESGFSSPRVVWRYEEIYG